MQITVLFDEESISDSLRTGFGLSLLIGDSVIFDTGSDGDALVHNIQTLGIDTSKIGAVVLSHDHWDHTDGLVKLLSVLHKPDVCVCRSSLQKLAGQIVEHGGKAIAHHAPASVAGNVYTTGEIVGMYKNEPMPEQSLFVPYSNSHVALISGCAHYGIAQSIDAIRERIARHLGRRVIIDLIIGGFHLSHESDDSLINISEKLRESGIRKVAPLHCSGKNGNRIMKSYFANGFHELKTGSSFKI